MFKYEIKSVKDIPTLKITENDVTTTLKLLPSGHEIKIKGDDKFGLANRLSFSYRNCIGKGTTGNKFLKEIIRDMKKRMNNKNMYTGFDL